MMNLYKPDSYKKAGRQVTSAFGNGCGTKIFGEKIRKMLNKSFGLRIREACDIHDWMYARQEGKLKADFIFLWNLQVLVWRRYNSWVAPFRSVVVTAYFFSVLLGGWRAYYRPE